MLEFTLFFVLLFFQLLEILSLTMKPLIPHLSPSCAVYSWYFLPLLFFIYVILNEFLCKLYIIFKCNFKGLLICLVGLLSFKRKAQIISLSYRKTNSSLAKPVMWVKNQEPSDLLVCFVFISSPHFNLLLSEPLRRFNSEIFLFKLGPRKVNFY